PLGPQCHLHALSRRSHPEQPGAQGLLSTPDCQGQEVEGGACRLHAQADRDPQHPDRATAEMGSRPLRADLIACSLDRASTERVQSQQTGERTGSRPSAAEGGGAPAPALSPADRRSTSSTVALIERGTALHNHSFLENGTKMFVVGELDDPKRMNHL